ncbi:hypothetical protein SCHPADRAFT_891762 [Schizopora paradoxa]|uniref:Uncharacterized protein n=1 Tax=Schizopora paradoxa TaxID=27342 RepID=A0A0H2RH70_9AGAM|nr:hypothetical protein SCHPADRAFT_891762 [Schizopora paradoxa]
MSYYSPYRYGTDGSGKTYPPGVNPPPYIPPLPRNPNAQLGPPPVYFSPKITITYNPIFTTSYPDFNQLRFQFESALRTHVGRMNPTEQVNILYFEDGVYILAVELFTLEAITTTQVAIATFKIGYRAFKFQFPMATSSASTLPTWLKQLEEYELNANLARDPAYNDSSKDDVSDMPALRRNEFPSLNLFKRNRRN